MQYLLVDAHRRYIGLLNSQRTFSVGDTFQNHNAQLYAVVGLNWSGNQSPTTQSLTVIPVVGAPKAATSEAG